MFRSRRDAEITRRVYRQHPVLLDRSGEEERREWPVRHLRMLDMAVDSDLFRTAERLRSDGFYKVAGNRWQRGKDVFFPLYEGKMVQAYDHRAASVVVNPDNLKRPGIGRESSQEQHLDPSWVPNARFWVADNSLRGIGALEWLIGFKRITAVTNSRTMIASLFPRVAFGHNVPILTPIEDEVRQSIDFYKKRRGEACIEFE